MDIREVSAELIAKELKIGIVISRFNDFFTKRLLDGAIDCILRHGGDKEYITVVWVPGANELPIAVDRIAKLKCFNAIVVLGVVIQGDTPHADLINTQVSRSLAKISLDTGIPVINGVVCALNLEQAIERCGSKAGNKGWQAALAAIEMANLIKILDKSI